LSRVIAVGDDERVRLLRVAIELDQRGPVGVDKADVAAAHDAVEAGARFPKGQLQQVVVGGGDDCLDSVRFDQLDDPPVKGLRRHTCRVETGADKVGERPPVAGLAHPLGHLGQRERLIQPVAAGQLAGQVGAGRQARDLAAQVSADEEGQAATLQRLGQFRNMRGSHQT